LADFINENDGGPGARLRPPTTLALMTWTRPPAQWSRVLPFDETNPFQRVDFIDKNGAAYKSGCVKVPRIPTIQGTAAGLSARQARIDNRPADASGASHNI
jgi:hypothetical protein